MPRLLLLPLLCTLTACVVNRPGGAPDISTGEHYLRYGVAAFADGQPDTAAVRFRQALQQFEETADREGQIRAHINLAELLTDQREPDRASNHLQQAARLNAQMQGSVFGQRIALLESSVAIQKKDYARAQTLLDALLDAYSTHETAGPLAVAALINRTLVAQASGSADLALWVPRLQRAVAASAPGDASLTARLKRFEARLAIDNGDFDSAEQLYRDALAFYEQRRQPRAIGVTLSEWAALDIARGHWQPAREKLQRAILLRDEALDHDGVIADLHRLALVAGRQGDKAQAEALQRLASALRDKGSGATSLRKILDNEPN